jgi:hypothetical protein
LMTIESHPSHLSFCFNFSRALSKAKAKKDKSLQRELQSEIRNLRKEIRKREVSLIIAKDEMTTDILLRILRREWFGISWRAEMWCSLHLSERVQDNFVEFNSTW